MIGKNVAKRPYTNLRLDNNVTDTGTGGNTPTNSGVTFTTDQFGRANMAGDWASGDYLEWSSSIGNTIAEFINDNATIIYNISIANTLNPNITLYQYGGSGNTNSSFYYSINYSAPDKRLQVVKRSGAGANSVIANVSLTDNNWYTIAYAHNINDINMYLDGDSVGSGTFDRIAYESSNLGMFIGNYTSNIFDGSLNNFRIYNVTLSDGQLKILNNEKGRIRV